MNPPHPRVPATPLHRVTDAAAAHLARYHAQRAAPASMALLFCHAAWQRQSVTQLLLKHPAFIAAMFVSGFSACMLSMLVLCQTHAPRARWIAGARRVSPVRRIRAPPKRCTTEAPHLRLRRRSQRRRLKPRPVPKRPNRMPPSPPPPRPGCGSGSHTGREAPSTTPTTSLPRSPTQLLSCPPHCRSTCTASRTCKSLSRR